MHAHKHTHKYIHIELKHTHMYTQIINIGIHIKFSHIAYYSGLYINIYIYILFSHSQETHPSSPL